MPIPLRWLVAGITAGAFILTILMMRLDMRVALNGASAGFATAAVILLLVRHRFRPAGPRAHPVAHAMAEDVLVFATTTLVGVIASYAVAACTTGWVDHAMVRLDHAIGFDWNDLYALTAAHPLLQIMGRIAYASIYASPAIILLSYALNRQRAEARFFLASFWLAAGLSLCFFLFMPTLGPLAYGWHGAIDYMPTSGLFQAEIIPLLRDHSMQVVDLSMLRGLVGIPSFHAASATLYILAARHTGSARAPLVLLNVAMIFSIPVEGTHYAVDLIGGMAVALVAHGVVTLLVRARRVPARDPIAYAPGVGVPAVEGAS
ncbi:phosphatase PAP2 family protein [Sphingobium sufflavum]|uniref:phosphatase PAP2 family protein n=1 Tax=Sphingobium sufflavum TaxID=1129547 RepID=UPI001F239322|nr:phosphatase PAP2 family protein [Sphingobium sufflavum]MCE7795312.1 phosphatase PAP2 family protein [Sphingobium sufflavum]